MRVFAVSENCSEIYKSRKDALKDLASFGDEIVKLYRFKKGEDIQQLTSEDIIGIYQYGKEMKYGEKNKNL